MQEIKSVDPQTSCGGSGEFSLILRAQGGQVGSLNGGARCVVCHTATWAVCCVSRCFMCTHGLVFTAFKTSPQDPLTHSLAVWPLTLVSYFSC